MNVEQVTSEEVATSTESFRITTPAGVMTIEVENPTRPEHALFVERMRELWSHLLVEESVADGAVAGNRAADCDVAAGNDDRLRLTLGDGLINPTDPTIGAATYNASGKITLKVLQKLVGERILLHSGVIEHPRHGVILLIGPSGAGKSTATTLLAREGRYLSDELAVLDPHTFRITAYPKPVSRVVAHMSAEDRENAHATESLRKADFTLASQGLTVSPRTDLVPQHIIVLARREEPGPVTFRRLSLADALVRVVEQSSSSWLLPDGLGTYASLFNSVGGVLEVSYTEASEISAAMDHLPDAIEYDWQTVWAKESGATPDDAPGAAFDAPGATPDDAPLTAPIVRLMPYIQALESEGDLVVLRHGRVGMLNGLGALVWDILRRRDGEATHAEIRRDLIEELGDHPQAGEFMDAALEQLCRGGLVAA